MAAGVTEPSSPTPVPSARPKPRRANRQVVGPFTLRHIAVLGGSVLSVAVVLIALTLPLGQPAPAAAPTPGSSFFQIGAPTTGLQVGQVAPELGGTVDGKTVQLTDLDGKPIRLADLRGRPVWISFWATWCPPCQQETPVLRAVYDTHKAQGLALIAISVQETTTDYVRNYVNTYGLDATIGFDGTSAVFKTYQAYGLPTHLFLDRGGVIRAIHLGPLTQVQAEQILAPLLSN
jgi:peroxiredoxin